MGALKILCFWCLFFSMVLSGQAQNGEGKHFWASTFISGGIHLKFGTQEKPVCILPTVGIGLLKELYDLRTKNNFSKNDLWHDLTGATFGFMGSDIYKRKTKKWRQRNTTLYRAALCS